MLSNRLLLTLLFNSNFGAGSSAQTYVSKLDFCAVLSCSGIHDCESLFVKGSLQGFRGSVGDGESWCCSRIGGRSVRIVMRRMGVGPKSDFLAEGKM